MSARADLVRGAIDLVRRQGVAGAGLAEILQRCGRSRRALYLNFPGGKTELIAAATEAAGEELTARMMQAMSAHVGLEDAIGAVIDDLKYDLVASDFTEGCPIVAAAQGWSVAPEAAAVAGVTFGVWRDVFANRFRHSGIEKAVAESLALMVVAAIEGAVVVSQGMKSTAPMDQAKRHISELLTLHRVAD